MRFTAISENRLSSFIDSQLLVSEESLSEPEVTGQDIGKLLEQGLDLNELSRVAKYQILTSEPISDLSTYPRTQQTATSPYLRQFQPEWLRSFPWLHYSRHANGVFCRACAVFAPGTVKGQKLSSFVTKPFHS
jgi:hypothetical protein